MNDRLYELINRCFIGTPDGRLSELNTVANIEKFAELIVQECLDVISDESEKVSDEWRCKDGKHIWWKIKEHFGVEE